ncbi:MAG: NAD-dependent epimerase/dehydratase family protein [Deltaproteobacteria bacterium]|nr:NAD-dependent epimerase/dehydratase family protein [Deltaproteobacteria bacterium]
MRVYVTGGSGFIGQHLLRALADAGHSARAMARSDRSAETVSALGAEPSRCDLETVSAADLEECDAVVHAAAYVEPYGPRERFEAINIGGTQRMLDAAREAGCGRFVHVGTEAVLFCGPPLEDVDETHPYPTEHRFLYSETKAEAERRVLAANAEGFATLSIRPRFVWGPGDTTVLPQILEAANAGAWLWMAKGRSRTSTTHVTNLIDALLIAIERGPGGEAYFVADAGTRTMREFVEALAATRGVTLRDVSVPGWVGRGLASGVERVWHLLRRTKQPPITRLGAAMMSTTVTVRTDKARRLLGWEPSVSVEQGMAELAAAL